ncbi:MAG: restriction endonuclease [Burkholderiales bacterium]|nr:restriction endonuclease [Burkholderiales bacterium]
MTRPLSRSDLLITATHEACLKALAAAPGGQLRRRDLLKAIEQAVPMDAWALEGLEASGVPRWHKIFGFSSVGMGKAGWVIKERGTWRITPEGRSLIAQPLEARHYLNELTARYDAWKSSQIAPTVPVTTPTTDEEGINDALLLADPEERIEQTLTLAHDTLAAELISTIKSCDPEFFERLVVKLLLKMGYGGSRQEAGQAVGRSGDGGIDGVINEDRLGLDAIYLQAKRWEGSVGEGPIRDFKGALDAKGAHKGVFITTSTFTPAAIEAARTSRSYRIVLIDGARLAQLMIEHDLGVSVAATYQLKRLDSDFFSED